MKKRYILIEKSPIKGTIYIDYEKIDGYYIKPKNNISYDGIIVNKLIIIKPNFIEKLIKKKIQKKLDGYLNFIINIIDDNDDDSRNKIDKILDDFERYKLIIKGIYFKYLDEKYYNLLLKKIDILNQELLKKRYIIENQKNIEEKLGKRR